MRFTYAETMIEPKQYFSLAVEAERAGYDSFIVPESILYPKESDSKYPYTPDGNREFLDGQPFIEPFVLMAALGAVTERLRFATFVVCIPAGDDDCIVKVFDRFDVGVDVAMRETDHAEANGGLSHMGIVPSGH